MGLTGDISNHREVLQDPDGTAALLLAAGINGLARVEVRMSERECVILRLTLEPWPALVEHGYPTEDVSILVWRNGTIATVPLNRNRPWLHVYLDPVRALCLWFPGDPRALRWEWEDGLIAYINILHRHMQAEECWRRHGVWPGEDAPHGPGEHQIRSAALRWRVAHEEAS